MFIYNYGNNKPVVNQGDRKYCKRRKSYCIRRRSYCNRRKSSHNDERSFVCFSTGLFIGERSDGLRSEFLFSSVVYHPSS